jgi:hypothetical protein
MLYMKRYPEMSVRDIGLKSGVPKSTVQDIKVRCGFKTYKKMKYPGRTASQFVSGKARGRKLIKEKLRQKRYCIIMDDESYFKLDCKTLPGPQFYTVPKGFKPSTALRAVKTEKFGKKVMVWQGICECGLKSSPFFTTETMNAQMYIRECLDKRLLPLIRRHNVPTLFWPDLASIHYAKATLDWYEANNVDFVPKNMNPPNVPQIRPIEKYWAISKQYLRKTKRFAENINQFRRLFISTTKKLDEAAVQRLMRGLRTKLRNYTEQKEDEQT